MIAAIFDFIVDSPVFSATFGVYVTVGLCWTAVLIRRAWEARYVGRIVQRVFREQEAR